MYKFSVKLSDKNTDACGISNIEVKDGFFGQPISKMDGKCVQDSRDWLIYNMKRAIVYTVNIPVDCYDEYVRALQNARALGVEAVKICACALGDCSDKTAEKLSAIFEIAQAVGVKIAFEPKAEYPDFTMDFYGKIRCDVTRLIYNPAEFVKENKNPFLQVLYKSKFKDDIIILRVNDRLYNGGYTMPELGNSEIKECASILLARSYEGYFSFEPYLENVSVKKIIEAFLETLTKM